MKTTLCSLLLLLSGLLLSTSLERRPLSTAGARVGNPTAMLEKQKITTFLWFDDDAEAAIAFYTSIFLDSKRRC